MSLPRWTETLTEYAELIQPTTDILELSNKNILLWQFSEFMKDVDYDFNVFDSVELNEELKERFNRLFFLTYYDQQVSGTCSPEWRFKMQFERIFLGNIDRYNGKLRIQLKSLKEIEDVLFQNYDLKTLYNETVQGVESANTVANDTTDTTKNKDTLDKTENTISKDTLDKSENTKDTDTTDVTNETVSRETSDDSTRNENTELKRDTDKYDRNFNREIFEDTPNGQLALTANDGAGIISTATNITENLEKSTSYTKQTDESTKSDSKNRTIDEDETRNATRSIGENQSESKERTIDENETGVKERNVNEDETENKTKNTTIDNDKTTNEDTESVRHITGYQNLGSKPKLLDEYSKMYQNTLLQFVNCFDKLFRHVY